MIELMYKYFTETPDFPIHMQYGFHDEVLYTHSHKDFSELIMVLDGCAEHIVNGESYGISKGDVFVISQDTEHGFISTDHLKICNIMFKPEEVFATVQDMKQIEGFQALFVIEPHYSQNYSFCSKLKLNNEKFLATETVLREVVNEYQSKNTGWKDMTKSGFYRLCIMLSRFYRTEVAKSENKFLKLAETVAYIENNYSSEIRIEELADISGYSERQLIRIFKSTFSVTPSVYIADLKIKKAKELLEFTNISIGEVGYRVGFDDQNYFSRFFRKNTGMTPSEYKTVIRNERCYEQ